MGGSADLSKFSLAKGMFQTVIVFDILLLGSFPDECAPFELLILTLKVKH